MISLPGIALVYAPTRLEGLRRRWGTAGQAKFRLKQAHAHDLARRAGPAAAAGTSQRGRQAVATKVKQPPAQQQAEFDEYEREEHVYKDVIDRLEDQLQFGLPVKR